MALIILCSCCMKPEPPRGWYARIIDGVTDEAYCSEDCREAHHVGLCGCFVQSDTYEMMGDEKL